jgi:hypothetical protein
MSWHNYFLVAVTFNPRIVIIHNEANHVENEKGMRRLNNTSTAHIETNGAMTANNITSPKVSINLFIIFNIITLPFEDVKNFLDQFICRLLGGTSLRL